MTASAAICPARTSIRNQGDLTYPVRDRDCRPAPTMTWVCCTLCPVETEWMTAFQGTRPRFPAANLTTRIRRNDPFFDGKIAE